MHTTKRIEDHIRSAAPYLEQIPGIVIIHYLHPATVVYITQNGLKTLDTTMEELREMGTEYHRRFFNPDDAADYVPKVIGMLERNNDEETITFFQQARAHEHEDWKWYTSGTRIFMKDDSGLPLLTITVALPIDAEHYYISKIERLLAENDFLRKNQHLYALLGKREKQILVMMVQDKPSTEIAGLLYLSEDTVKTHRRNIKKKLSIQNHYDLMRFAQAFDLV